MQELIFDGFTPGKFEFCRIYKLVSMKKLFMKPEEDQLDLFSFGVSHSYWTRKFFFSERMQRSKHSSSLNSNFSENAHNLSQWSRNDHLLQNADQEAGVDFPWFFLGVYEDKIIFKETYRKRL